MNQITSPAVLQFEKQKQNFIVIGIILLSCIGIFTVGEASYVQLISQRETLEEVSKKLTTEKEKTNQALKDYEEITSNGPLMKRFMTFAGPLTEIELYKHLLGKSIPGVLDIQSITLGTPTRLPVGLQAQSIQIGVQARSIPYLRQYIEYLEDVSAKKRFKITQISLDYKTGQPLLNIETTLSLEHYLP